MLCSRVIPCLDVQNGRVVKGVNFRGLRDVGDPQELASEYVRQGADELVLLDIAATPDGRGNALATVRSVRTVLSIPLTVGGGVRTVQHAKDLLAAGADKIAVNSAAVQRPDLLRELSERFGSQCVVLAIDASRSGANSQDSWEVLTHGGARQTGLDLLDWTRQGTRLGAGEVLLTSFDRDGTGAGYDLEMLSRVAQSLSVPLIASGGARTTAHVIEALNAGASAVLLASILHDGETSVDKLKQELSAQGIEVRQ